MPREATREGRSSTLGRWGTSPGHNEHLLSAEEVAEMIGMTNDYVYELSRRGRIQTNHLCGAVSRKLPAPIPRLALTPPEAAAAIGVGEDFFTEHVRPELQLIRRGRKVLVPVAELERWMGANAERPWGAGQRRPPSLAGRSVARR